MVHRFLMLNLGQWSLVNWRNLDISVNRVVEFTGREELDLMDGLVAMTV